MLFLIFPTKALNHVVLTQNLQRILNVSSPYDANLICANNHNQETPCPGGYCQVTSNGGSGFNRQCLVQNPNPPNQAIQIESDVVGETEPESVFTYQCKTHMCNSNENAEKVRNLLKAEGLLTPAGVQSGPPGPSGAAMALSCSISTVIHYILMLTITLFFKA